LAVLKPRTLRQAPVCATVFAGSITGLMTKSTTKAGIQLRRGWSSRREYFRKTDRATGFALGRTSVLCYILEGTIPFLERGDLPDLAETLSNAEDNGFDYPDLLWYFSDLIY
jgi:hypothetical protein